MAHHQCAGAAGSIGRAIARSIVDNDADHSHAIDFGRYAAEHACDDPGLIVRGHDNRNGLAHIS